MGEHDAAREWRDPPVDVLTTAVGGMNSQWVGRRSGAHMVAAGVQWGGGGVPLALEDIVKPNFGEMDGDVLDFHAHFPCLRSESADQQAFLVQQRAQPGALGLHLRDVGAQLRIGVHGAWRPMRWHQIARVRIVDGIGWVLVGIRVNSDPGICRRFRRQQGMANVVRQNIDEQVNNPPMFPKLDISGWSGRIPDTSVRLNYGARLAILNNCAGGLPVRVIRWIGTIQRRLASFSG